MWHPPLPTPRTMMTPVWPRCASCCCLASWQRDASLGNQTCVPSTAYESTPHPVPTQERAPHPMPTPPSLPPPNKCPYDRAARRRRTSGGGRTASWRGCMPSWCSWGRGARQTSAPRCAGVCDASAESLLVQLGPGAPPNCAQGCGGGCCGLLEHERACVSSNCGRIIPS